MPYATGPYSAHSSLPSPSVTTVHSSRAIDPATKRYQIDDNGNPEQMPSTRQRVLLQLDFAVGELPKFITDPDLERRKKQIEQALQLLVDSGAIRVESITLEQLGPGSVRERISYTDLATGVDDTITRTQ